ncbi:MAG: DUF61 family protein [Nitrososphaerota archaeon]
MSEGLIDKEAVTDALLVEYIKKLGASMPAKRLSIRQLLLMDEPSVNQVNGEKHFFNKNELIKAAELLRGCCLECEVFPIVFVPRKDLGKDVYLIKGHGAEEVFRILMGLSSVNKTPDGQAYTYKALVIEFIKKFPSLGIISVASV